MSKRSHRRLAVVAGAALAVGSMAPAMAARVNAGSAAGASVDTIDITDINLPVGQQDLGLGLGLVTGIAGSLLTTVGTAPNLVLGTATTLAGDALCVPAAVVSTALGTSIDAVAGLHVGLGSIGAGAGVGSLLDVPFATVGSVTGCAFNAVDDALATVGAVQVAASPIVNTGLGVVNGVSTTALALPGMVPGLVGQVFGLGDLLTVNAGGSVGLGAALAGIL